MSRVCDQLLRAAYMVCIVFIGLLLMHIPVSPIIICHVYKAVANSAHMVFVGAGRRYEKLLRGGYS